MLYFNDLAVNSVFLVSDFTTVTVHSVGNSFYTEGFTGGYHTNSANDTFRTPFRAWTFASFTQTEIDAIKASTAPMTVSKGSFPNINQHFVSLPTYDSVAKKMKFSIKNNNLHHYVSGSHPISTTSDQNNRWIIAETTVPVGKENITHMVFVGTKFRYDSMTPKESSVEEGTMTIEPDTFIALTVGLPGSGAEIIMDDTSIKPGKMFILSKNTNPTFDVTLDLNLNISQVV